MKLTRFKGVHDLVIEFSPSETNIFGANGTGKTTIFDAFTWVLFGKDSTDRKDFEIKTLDAAGKPLNRVGHEVELLICVDGQEIEIRRIYAEKWSKQRGSEELTFQGHEESFFWNGVPLKKGDYQKEVSSICEEFVFKLITSPTAFNALPWKDRRDMLTQIAGNVSDADIAGANPAYLELVANLAKYKSEDDYKKMLQASVEKSKKEIKLIPARIDEVEKSKPETKPFDRIRELIGEKEKQVSKLDEQIEDSTKAYQAELEKINAHNRQIMAVKAAIGEIEYKANLAAKKACEVDYSSLKPLEAAATNAHQAVLYVEKQIDTCKNDIQRGEAKNEAIGAAIQKLRDRWAVINAKEFHDTTTCPTCKQDLPADQVEAAKARFAAEKAQQLADINASGKDETSAKDIVFSALHDLKNKLNELQADLEAKKADHNNAYDALIAGKKEVESKCTLSFDEVYEQMLADSTEHFAKNRELTELEATRPEQPVVDNESLKENRRSVQTEINSLQQDLQTEQQIKKANARVEELKAQEKSLAQEIANVDKQIFALEEFTKLKVDEIERRVRDQFQLVSFRMFREQVNGGLEPCCDTLINGVPFSDANTASRINAGIDIINTLSKHFGVSAPVFLDNRESVSDIIDTDAQLINLVVSPAHAKLFIDDNSRVFANA